MMRLAGARMRSPQLTSAFELWREEWVEAEQVAAVPGDAFGKSGEGFLRCCYATGMDDLKAAMDAMERYIGTLS